MFKKRELKSIVFSGTVTPEKRGKSVKTSISDGDTVDLETKEGLTVIIGDVKRIKDDKFKGVISHFDTIYTSDIPPDLKAGDEVKFLEENIISCRER